MLLTDGEMLLTVGEMLLTDGEILLTVGEMLLTDGEMLLTDEHRSTRCNTCPTATVRMSPRSVGYFCPLLAKIALCPQILVETQNTKLRSQFAHWQ
jgi:hypothetical protein